MSNRHAALQRTYARLPGEPSGEEAIAAWEAAHGDDSGAVASGTPAALRGGVSGVLDAAREAPRPPR